MNGPEWEKSVSPRQMLECAQKLTTDRKMRLFACACCRRFWADLPDERSRRFVETVERFADGLESDASLDRAYFAAEEAAAETSDPVADAVVGLYGVCAAYEYQDTMRGVTAERAATLMADCASSGIAAERAVQAQLLRDILGPIPFQSVTPNSPWLSRTVVDLAHIIYNERAFDRLPFLADALEDAGCDNLDILNHCRSDGPHVRGCWVVDLLLGRS